MKMQIKLKEQDQQEARLLLNNKVNYLDFLIEHLSKVVILCMRNLKLIKLHKLTHII